MRRAILIIAAVFALGCEYNESELQRRVTGGISGRGEAKPKSPAPRPDEPKIAPSTVVADKLNNAPTLPIELGTGGSGDAGTP